jgi:hypothetical protein
MAWRGAESHRLQRGSIRAPHTPAQMRILIASVDEGGGAGK